MENLTFYNLTPNYIHLHSELLKLEPVAPLNLEEIVPAP